MPGIKSSLKIHLLLLALLSSLGLSQATWAAPCTSEVNALKAVLNDGICNFSNACKGLSHKLDNANRKLEQGKYRHAARRLADFGAVVENMANHKKSRIDRDGYEQMMAGFFNPAVACINNPHAVGADDDGAPAEGEEVIDPSEEAY